MNILRRTVLRSGVLFAALGVGSPALSRACHGSATRVGAIRWDAWYGGPSKSSAWYAEHNLDPPRYHLRAPFFAKPNVDGTMSIWGSQADMDREIDFASNAGITFWAFCQFPRNSAMRRGWQLYQSSSIRSKVKWCWIFSYGGFVTEVQSNTRELINELTQEDYELVSSLTPILFLLDDGTASSTQVAASVNLLRERCASFGRGLYVVLMSGAANVLSTASIIGVDATSHYAHTGGTSVGRFSALASEQENYWKVRASQYIPYIPCAMTGWNRLPRIDHPVPWERHQTTGSYSKSNFELATPLEIANHIQAMLTFIDANIGICSTRHALIYAWNEFDEGGWLCPTWTPNGQDQSRLSALATVICK